MPRSNTPVTALHHIAKKVNLSISTVSRALRNTNGISPTTRTAVLQAASSLGYDLATRERAVSQSNHNNIITLAQCTWRQSDQRFLAGMSRASVLLNLSILSHHVPLDECGGILDPKTQPSSMKSCLIDGIVLIHRWPEEVVKRLSEHWPTVSISHEYPNSKVDVVAPDSRNGIFSLVKHLKEKGHTQLGFFGFCSELTWANSRFAGFVESLARLGLSFSDDDVIRLSLEEALAVDRFPIGLWMDAVVKRVKNGTTAWVCSSDVIGESLHKGLLDQGLSIPNDIAVTGFHRRIFQPLSQHILTSVSVPDEEIGAVALRLLLQRIRFPEEPTKTILIRTKLVIGKST